MKIVVINVQGAQRVLSGKSGMTFVVDSFTDTVDKRGLVAHVRDYRYRQSTEHQYQIWSIGPEGYSVIEE